MAETTLTHSQEQMAKETDRCDAVKRACADVSYVLFMPVPCLFTLSYRGSMTVRTYMVCISLARQCSCCIVSWASCLAVPMPIYIYLHSTYAYQLMLIHSQAVLGDLFTQLYLSRPT